jgi:hypothetical protein
MTYNSYIKITKLFLLISSIFLISIIGLSLISIINSNEGKIESGIYTSYQSNFTIELNENGNVFITPKKNNSFYCKRKGNWTLNDSNITIQITDKNEDIYCDWVENLEGIWKINGNTISKDNYTLIKK